MDDASDPVDSVPKANLLVNHDHVMVQVGEAGPDAQAIYKIFTKAGIPFLTAGGDTYFDANTDPMLWRLTPSDNQLGVAMALWAHHQGYKRGPHCCSARAWSSSSGRSSKPRSRGSAARSSD